MRSSIFVFVIFFLSGSIQLAAAQTILRLTITPSSVSASDVRDGVTITLTLSKDSTSLSSAPDPVWNTTILSTHKKSERSVGNATHPVGLIYYARETLRLGFNERWSENPSIVSAVTRVSDSVLTLRLYDTEYRAFSEEEVMFHALVPSIANATVHTNAPVVAMLVVDADTPSIVNARIYIVAVTAYISLVTVYIMAHKGFALTAMFFFVKISLVARVTECSDGLDFILHITQVRVLPDLAGGSEYYFAGLIMNTGILVFVTLVHWIVSNVNALPLNFPSSCFHLAAFASGGIWLACADLIYGTQTPLRFTLGLVMCGIFTTGYLASLFLTSRSTATALGVMSRSDEHEINNDASTVDTFTKEINDNSVFSFRPSIYASYIPEKLWFPAVEAVEVLVLCLMSAIAPSTDGPKGCQARGITTFVIAILFLGAHVAVRPYVNRFDGLLWMGLQGMFLLASFLGMLDTFSDDPASVQEILSEVVLILIALSVLGRVVAGLATDFFSATKGGTTNQHFKSSVGPSGDPLDRSLIRPEVSYYRQPERDTEMTPVRSTPGFSLPVSGGVSRATPNNSAPASYSLSFDGSQAHSPIVNESPYRRY